MKKLICLLLSVLLLSVCTCGCVREEQNEQQLYLWFTAESAEGSLSLEREPYAGDADIPRLAQALLAGPKPAGGLTSPIPAGVTLQNWNQIGDMAWLDLSEAYGKLEGVRLTLADCCIALTMTQLEGVERVSITVNGSALKQRGQQVFRRDDMVFSGAEEEPVELTAALCFRRAGGNELGTELRVFRLIESESASLAVLQALLEGPREAGLTALLPPELEVYSARVEAGICYADFSALLLETVPETEEEQGLVIRSVVESLCSLGHVRGVQLMMEGEVLERYGVIDTGQPLT